MFFQFEFIIAVHKATVKIVDGHYLIKIENGEFKNVKVTPLHTQQNRFSLRTNIDGKFSNISAVISPENVTIFNENGKIELEFVQPKFLTADSAASTANQVVSPMPGVLDKLYVKVGDKVKTGDPLAVIIAMKMEHVLKAPRDGVVKAVGGVAGQNVAKGAAVVKFEENDSDSD
jgi:3-methylcrotonyl-CoA carboxylase alpha subunit